MSRALSLDLRSRACLPERLFDDVAIDQNDVLLVWGTGTGRHVEAEPLQRVVQQRPAHRDRRRLAADAVVDRDRLRLCEREAGMRRDRQRHDRDPVGIVRWARFRRAGRLRLGDAPVRSTALRSEAQEAFASLQSGNAEPIAKLAPTSLVFGAWDSRGEGAKLPRLIQSVIRAWDVDELKRSAQYNPPLDYSALDVFDAEDKAKAEGNTKSSLAQRGFVHVPARGQPGGIVARGGVWRDVIINLITLRRLAGDRADVLRRYILGLCLVAAAEPLDGFLRVGCLLTKDPTSPGAWAVVDREGLRTPVALTPRDALDYAVARAKAFGVAEARAVSFDKDAAKADLADTAEGKKASKKTKAVAGS